MSYRNWFGTAAIRSGRAIGMMMGCELVVEVDEHKIELGMEVPDTTSRAWDSNLFSSGNMFIKGYANPVKPDIDHNPDLDDPDTVNGKDDVHTELISSSRYQKYMHQELISQLLNPRQQWRLIVYAVIGLAMMMVINLVMTAMTAGVI